jgi:hypothetical protein
MTRPAVRCPRCKLVIVPRMTALVPRYCPRCLARRRLAVEFEQVPRGRPRQPDSVSRTKQRRSDEHDPDEHPTDVVLVPHSPEVADGAAREMQLSRSAGRRDCRSVTERQPAGTPYRINRTTGPGEPARPDRRRRLI